MSNEVFWSLIIGSLSVGLGWVLNEVSQLFRNRGENGRIKKRVMHDLLEMNFILSRLDLKPLIEVMIVEIEKSINQKFSQNEKAEICSYIQSTFSINLENDIIDEIEDLDDSYLNAIAELSKVDPLRAYYLRNKTRLFENMDKIENYFKSLKKHPEISNNNISLEITNAFNPFIANRLSEEIINLREDTLDLAGSIGIRTKRKVKKILKKNLEPTMEMREKMQKMISKIINNIQINGQTEKRN